MSYIDKLWLIHVDLKVREVEAAASWQDFLSCDHWFGVSQIQYTF